MLAWAVSEVGLAAAQRLARRYGLNNEADDLVSMTLEKITRSFARRAEPLPDVANDDQAIRYAYRAMANLAVVVVVAAATGARRQRRFLMVPAHTYKTPFTTRVAPTPAHFVPTIAGTSRATV